MPVLTRREIPILIVNAVYVAIFGSMSIRRSSAEFMIYLGVILLVAGLIVWKQRIVQFDRGILWGLTVWGMLHLAGGNIEVGGRILYGFEVISVVPRYHILRYDQIVHFWGFGVATLACSHLLAPYLRDDVRRSAALLFLIVLMGSGFGALNEIIEFVVDESLPETNVGGYRNTMLDLVFNLCGSISAALWLAATKRGKHASP